MLKSLKKKMKDQAGLTLIELLVVIVILGIIAAVAIPMVMSQKDTAEANTNKQNLAVVQDAVSRYHAVTGNLPRGEGNALDATTLENGYLKKVPTKCANGSTNATFTVADNGTVTSSCTQ